MDAVVALEYLDFLNVKEPRSHIDFLDDLDSNSGSDISVGSSSQVDTECEAGSDENSADASFDGGGSDAHTHKDDNDEYSIEPAED